MQIKIIEKKIRRKPPPSRVFKTLEYRQVRPGVYMGGSWHSEDEFPRSCWQKWILQAVQSKRDGGRVVKPARHICTIKFYDVVDALRDISPDQYVGAFMELPYVRMSLERCFGNGDESQEAVQKVRAAIAMIVTTVMSMYNTSEESRVHGENKRIRLEVDSKVVMEGQAYGESRRVLEMRELAIEEEMRPVREAATVLAERFFRQAVMEYHPDFTKGVAVEVANEKMIALLAVKDETFKAIKNVKLLPEDCQNDDIPF